MAGLRFDDYELDPSVPELRRRGRRVHLQVMPLRALQMLLEQPNELVSRAAFFARLWPHDDTGILDDNLNTAIRKLRLALDDSAHHPRYIETVPKCGYRFVAPVHRDDGTESRTESPVAAEDSTTQGAAANGGARVRPVGIALAAAALAAVAVMSFIVLARIDRDRGDDTDAAVPRDFTSLAVLPFVNAGPNPGNQYFSNGLAEELMDSLSRHQGLRVVSRTSAFALQDRERDAKEIGRLLEADALVEGSVRRDGDRLRISVRLVDSSTGYQLWSETYDRRMDDVFAVQQDIALSIANTLTGKLLGRAEAEALAAPETDPAAYDDYLKGRYYWHRRTEQDLRAAASHFEAATRRAPDYAPAWAGLADAYAVLGFYDYLPPAEAFPLAKAAALRTLEIDPDNASAEATLGYVTLYYDWDLAQAETHFRQSIALRPDYSKARQWYGNLLTAAGRFDEAEREMRYAQQLDPLSLIANAALGWVRYHGGNSEAALTQYRLTLQLDPDFELAYLWSGWALETLGRYDEALAMLREAVARSGGSGISSASLARVHALRGEREEAVRILKELEQSDGYVPAYEIAKAWFALDEPAQANDWLRRAYEERSHSLMFLRVDPQLADVRHDDAFVRLVAEVNGS